MARLSFACVAFFAVFLWANAVALTEDKAKSLGDYGFGHEKLHKHGVIKNLIKRTGENCCDGGEGGECRVTRIRLTGTGAKAFLDGKWCSVTAPIRFDIELPRDVFAVVCASKIRDPRTECPISYCAAMTPGT